MNRPSAGSARPAIGAAWQALSIDCLYDHGRLLGIIGGSGVYDLPGVEDLAEARSRQSVGRAVGRDPTGRIGDTRIAFLPRHGRGHRISPSDINYRANIDAMKRLGVPTSSR